MKHEQQRLKTVSASRQPYHRPAHKTIVLHRESELTARQRLTEQNQQQSNQ